MEEQIKIILQEIDSIMKEILTHTKDMKSQGELVKRRQFLIEKVENLEKQCDDLISDYEKILERNKDEI